MPQIDATCFIDRRLILDLSPMIATDSGLPNDTVAQTLDKNVNYNNEKVSVEHRQKFAALVKGGEKAIKQQTISAFEAANFIKYVLTNGEYNGNSKFALIARSLNKIYFGGKLLDSLPKQERVVVKSFHDPDTGTVEISPIDGCFANAGTETVRTTGIDGLEVGRYAEPREKPKQSFEQEVEFIAYSEAVDKGKQGGFVNPKLVANVDSTHLQISKGKWDPKQLPPKARAAMNQIIAITSDYSGNLSTLPLNDLITWNASKNETGAAILFGSEIRWTSSDTPSVLCGTWQPFDKYGRVIGGFASIEKDLYSRYIRKGLAPLMATKGKELYAAYQRAIEPHLRALKEAGSEDVYEAAKGIATNVIDPSILFSQENCDKMATEYDALIATLPSYLAYDQQLFQILIGSVYSYIKYRNQVSDAYEAANTIAQKNNFGHWTETTFRALYEFHKADPRYHPADCKK